MVVSDRIAKPRTHRAKKALQVRAPKVVENVKQMMFFKGEKVSKDVGDLMKDIACLKQPYVHVFNKREAIHPFENCVPIENLSQHFDMSLFSFGSHSKKRPNNLILGRMFHHKLLDMMELGVESYRGMSHFKSANKVTAGTKPVIVFSGDVFHMETEYKRLQSLLSDIFRGPEVKLVRRAGLEHVIMFTAADGKIYMRNYRVLMEKSGTVCPRVELEEMGPSADFTLRRSHLASDDFYNSACKQTKRVKPSKKKNISEDVFGSKLGRVHMERQDMSKFQVRKIKGLKKNQEEKKEYWKAKRVVKRKEKRESKSTEQDMEI